MDNIPLLAKKVEGIAHTKQKHSLFDLFNFSVGDTPWAFFVPEHIENYNYNVDTITNLINNMLVRLKSIF